MNWLKRHKLSMVFVLLFVILMYFGSFLVQYKRQPIYGVSFDPEYARYLLPNTGEAYMALLNDWQFRYVRLPAHWDVVEKKQGTYDFSDLDWYMDRTGDVGGKVMLAIGQKTPRWPECHIPAWAKDLQPEDYRRALLRYMSAVVERYKNHPGLELWQVENEPFLGFGSCAELTPDEARQEVELVKQLDPVHKTIMSDSGELSLWRKTANVADLFGTTVYRNVWNKHIGSWSYGFIPSAYYRLRLWVADRSPEEAFIIELQAEPWITKDIDEVSPVELLKIMDKKTIEKNMIYAERIGLPRVYLWGAEWWYWLKVKGYNEIPDFIQQLPKQP